MGTGSSSEIVEGVSAASNVPNQGSAAADSVSRKRSLASKSRSAFRTISEVASELDVQQHVLRFWETKFSQIRPLKRGGGRRYYRPEDVELLRSIRHLLYTEGYTIKGVQKMLKEQGKKAVFSHVSQMADQAVRSSTSKSSAVVGGLSPEQTTPHPSETQAVSSAAALSDGQKEVLQAMLEDLKALRDMIKAD